MNIFERVDIVRLPMFLSQHKSKDIEVKPPNRNQSQIADSEGNKSSLHYKVTEAYKDPLNW